MRAGTPTHLDRPPSSAPSGTLPVIIAGAGPAGLAVAGSLARRGVRATLLEAGEAVAWAWRRHYPSLRLHTTRRDSHLPGRPLPGDGDPYPTRDELTRYLEVYAQELDADLRLACPVHRLWRNGTIWEVETGDGLFRSRHVVVATGFNRRPTRPELPGEASFGGPVLHSAQWQELGQMAGKRVLVAGLGNTGADLVEALSDAGSEVAVAVRGSVHLVPKELLGINWRTWYRLVPGLAFLLGRLGGPAGRRRVRRSAAAFWVAVHRRCFGDLERRGLRLQTSEDLLRHWDAGRPPPHVRPLHRPSPQRASADPAGPGGLPARGGATGRGPTACL